MTAPAPLLPLDVRDDLRAAFLVERSAQSHASVAWSSGGGPPALHPSLRAVVLARASFSEPVVSRFGADFLCSFPLQAAPGAPALAARAPAFAAVVVSRAFAPERHLTLAKALAEAYAAHGNQQHAQASWLSAFAQGRVPRSLFAQQGALAALPAPALAGPELAWDGAAFDAARTFRPTGARAVLQQLGVEAVVVWAALALRRRVAVVGRRHELARVVRTVRVLSLLLAHRLSRVDGLGAVGESPAAVCFPYVALSADAFAAPADEPERAAAANRVALDGAAGAAFARAVEEAARAQLEDLRLAATYVAGFTDAAVLGRGGEVWDVCVELGGVSGK